MNAEQKALIARLEDVAICLSSDMEIEYRRESDMVRNAIAEIQRLAEENEKLKSGPNFQAFVSELIQQCWIDHGPSDCDGGTFQDLAEKHGVLTARKQVGPCGEGCNCELDEGQVSTCYTPHPSLFPSGGDAP